MRLTVVEKDEVLAEREKEIYRLKDAVKAKEGEHKKALSRIRHIEDHVEEMEEEKGAKEEDQNGPGLTGECVPAKRTPAKVKRMRELEEFGKKMTLRVDEKAKYYQKFRVSGNEVEKLHGPTYQLFSHNPIPKEEKVFFDIRIIQIKNYNIVVGVITDKNKDEQFSFKKMNCVCYNGYDGSICEQDKHKYVTLKPKENHKIRTVVDLANLKIEWLIIGGELSKIPIGSAAIPATMVKQPLFPYFELYWEGNKVKLNN